jgi:hypothetical protein
MVASEHVLRIPRRKEVEDDVENTPAHTTRKSAKVDKTPAVSEAPRKKPTAKKFDIRRIPEIPKFWKIRLIFHDSPQSKQKPTT